MPDVVDLVECAELREPSSDGLVTRSETSLESNSPGKPRSGQLESKVLETFQGERTTHAPTREVIQA